MTDYAKLFDEMRHDRRFHLGMGDIRITVAMQDEIASLAARLAEQEKREQETANQLIDKTARLAEAERELKALRGVIIDVMVAGESARDSASGDVQR